MFKTISIMVPPGKDNEGNEIPARTEEIELNTDKLLFVVKPLLQQQSMIALDGAIFSTMNIEPLKDVPGLVELKMPDGGLALVTQPIFYRSPMLGQYILAYAGQLSVTVAATGAELKEAFEPRTLKVFGAE